MLDGQLRFAGMDAEAHRLERAVPQRSGEDATTPANDPAPAPANDPQPR